MGLDAALLSLRGLSVGDALGQSLFSPEATAMIERRELPPAPWRWTDDTQMALSVVEELQMRGWIDQDYLARRMAWRYKTDPARGYGKSARQVLDRIVQGGYFRTVSRSVHNGGSYGSSGAARSAPLGAFFADTPLKAVREAPLAVAITHLHPESLAAAQAVAAAAAIAANPNPPTGAEFLGRVGGYLGDSQVAQRIKHAADIPGGDLEQCLDYLGRDRFSSVLTAVPFALWCAAHHLDNFKDAIWAAAAGLGFMDVTCAMVGAIVALSTGEVPADWAASCEPLPNSGLTSHVEAGQELAGYAAGTAPANPLEARSQESLEGISSIRVDPLTGLPNLLGMLDQIEQLSGNPEAFPISLVIVHLVPLWDINRIAGRTAGNNLLRESARMLDETGYGRVYRTGGDKFVIHLNEDGGAIEKARQIAKLTTLPNLRLPRTALIHFPYKEEAIGGRLLACLSEVLSDRYYLENDGSPREFDAPEIRAMEGFSWMMVDLASQIQQMGQMVDEVSRLAQTDMVSQLPNLRAAMTTLETAVKQANTRHESLAVLLFDGDNLRQYNQVSYEAGDEAIRLIGSTLQSQLRQTDFLARWRTGDEFLIILPDTTEAEAVHIGERICHAVGRAAQSWLFPSTISGGIGIYPAHGPTVQNLLHAAEKGLEAAKAGGKNRVMLAGEEPD